VMFSKTVLDNGVRILSERIEHLKSVSIGIWVNTGSRDELTQENGISHFIEHMIFKGTRNRSSFQIAKELDAIGGLSNAFTGKENTCFHTRVLGRHFGIAADILSDIFLNSKFDPKDVERERQVVLQEISMVEDCPDENIQEIFSRVFWTGHPIGMSILGTGESVSAFSKQTILDYINRYYLPERIIIAAAGDVNHDEMVSHFESTFGFMEKGRWNPERVAPASNSDIEVSYKPLEQVHICLGGEAPSQRSEKRYSCAVLNTIFGGNMSSRLFQEIRERQGLAYNVCSFMSSYIDAGLLGVYAATDKENVNRLLESIRREIEKICGSDLSDSDLDAAKEHIAGSIYLSAESADNRMMRMTKNEFIFGRYVPYEEVVCKLKEVSKNDVIEVAREIFRQDGLALATLGPMKEEGLDKNSFFTNQ